MHALSVEAAASMKPLVVTGVDLGAGFFGFSNIGGGAISGSYGGASFSDLYSSPANDLFFNLSGTGYGAAFFSHLVVLDSAGVWRRYLASAATYTEGGGTSHWSWGSGSNKVWTGAGSFGILVTPYK